MPPRERVQHRHAIDASPNAGGPASKGNFTTFDDDGWWDDDENYWDDDYDWENYDSADDDAPHVAFIKSTPNPKSRANLDDVKGVGGVFMMLLEVRTQRRN